MPSKLTCTRLWLTTCMLLLATVSFAQKAVTGKVISNKDKQPLPGATVTVKGTVTATQTDGDGVFKITVADNAVLMFSGVGFTTLEIPVGSKTEIIASLEETSASLDEIIITGYSSQKKKDLTGAVSVVNVEQMNKQPTASISDQLQGQAAGVTILGSGSPGEPPQFRIRGFNTFGNNAPLFVVDGVPTTNITDINPNDIASLQVLKDAGAASIYGSRASNGVVIITTKKGKGKVKVSYSGYVGVQSPKGGNVFDALSPQEQGDLKKLAIKNTADRSGTAPNYSDALYGNGATAVLPDYLLPVGAMEGSPLVNPALYNVNPNYTTAAEYDAFYRITKANKSGTDWYHEIFKDAPITSHDINVAGGSEQGNYLFSFNYFNQEGTLIETYNKRYTIRANTNYNISKSIRIGENLAFSIIDNPRIAILDEGNPVSMAYRQHPIIPVRDIMGNYAGTFGPVGLGQATNPVAARERSANSKGLGSRLFGNVYAEVDFLKHLMFRSSFGGEYYSYRNRSFNYPTYENQENGQSNSYNEGMGSGHNWTWTNTLNFQKDFGEHNIKVVAGTEAYSASGADMSASTKDYFSFDPNFTNLTTGASVNSAPQSSRYAESLYSLIGRVDYNYKGRYLLGATIRRDGSSKFAEANRFGVFPAFSLGWRISDETFMKEVAWLTDLKLRGSWGIMGNQLNLGASNAFTTFRADKNSTFYDINGTNTGLLEGFRQNQFGNADAKWEEDEAYNIGFDASINNGMFEITADYYVKNIKDMLFNPPLPGVAGAADAPTVNVAAMRTAGFDLSIGTHLDINQDLKLDINGTFTTYNNEILNISDGIEYFEGQARRFNGSNIIRNAVGQPISSYFGYDIVGFWNTQAEIDAANEVAKKATNNPNANFQTDAAVGRFRYNDFGKGIVTPESRTFLGNANPDFSYGLNVSLSYKAFDFNMFFYGVQGNQIWNQVRWWTDFYPSFAGGKSRTALYDSWTPTRTNAKAPIVENAGTFSSNGVPNSYYVESGSYLRNKNMQIGYTVNADLLKRFGVSRLRAYVQAANLFTITPYSGIDPEIGGGPNQFGIDEGAYPAQRQILFGLNVTF